MTQFFADDLARIDWDELAALYRVAPLGDKSAADLRLVFENSRFRKAASSSACNAGVNWPSFRLPICP